MKSLLFILFIMLASCTFTKQQKAEHLVKVYLDNSLNDPHSYESVAFSPVHKHFEIKNNDSVMNGWEITHTYRAKNGFGALGLHTAIFQIDSSMSKVLYGDKINR